MESGMKRRNLRTAFGILTFTAAMACAADLGSVFDHGLAGHILGEVRNSAGVPQMGASVALYNRYDQEIRQVLTNESGKFVFDTLPPDLYSIRASLASFVPALRKNIAVVAGSENLLKINLASVFSTVELVPAAAARGTLMSDDWKWVLRASQATRPVFRYLPVGTGTSTSKTQTKVFSDVTGLVRVSADDSDASQQGLGTSFALSTRLNGAADVRVSGKVGYTTGAGLPAGALRTTYSRTSGLGPQISFTVRQVYLPALAGSGAPPSTDLVLRTAALSVNDSLRLTEHFLLEYGASLESASYLQRVNAVSPYGRLTANVGKKSVVRVAFAEGTQPLALVSTSHEIPSTDLNQDLALLSLLPRISLRSDRLRMEQAERFEAGYETVRGSLKLAAAAYREDVRDGVATLVGDQSALPSGDVIPDFDSHNQIVDIGNYRRTGYAAGASQALGEHMEVSISAGYSGSVIAPSHVLNADDAPDLRGWLHKANRPWVTARLTATIPTTGTKLATSYGWSDYNSIAPTHLFLTSGFLQQEMGWNMSVRQPLPSFGTLSKGRMEAGAEIRNLLSDGYVTLLSGGKQNVLTSSPRSLRGSLSFIF
jgi:Carboxypeptidase regulatory-like domain/TonB dependent receptor